MIEFTQESIDQAIKTFEEAETQEEGLEKMFDELEIEEQSDAKTDNTKKPNNN